jgi:uncharacterized membrane protein YeaQ/YmgE (transglycosylase-associated protein family)
VHIPLSDRNDQLQEVFMNGLFWVLVAGGCGWLTGKIIGGKGYGETLGSNATKGLDILLGIVGAGIGSYLFSWAISGEGTSFNRYTAAILASMTLVGVSRQLSERKAYRDFFDLQRTRFFKRQKRIGQYAWLVLAAFVVSFGWLYFDTVNKTTAAKQIAAFQTQTLPTAEGKEMVLTVPLSDGNNVKYLIKSAKADTVDAAVTQGLSKEPVSAWELSKSGTALSIGDNVLPLGIAVKISH